MDAKAIQQVFVEIDTNNNGFLEPDEIHALMNKAHVDITDEDLEDMIQGADTNGDGKIDIQEFKKLLADF
jgi:Ca2+-binding EF-hand superfamily protein